MSSAAYGSMYTLTFSDGHFNNWYLDFDGNNHGQYFDAITNAHLSLNGIDVGNLYLGHYGASGKWVAGNAVIGTQPLYSNFVAFNEDYFTNQSSFTAYLYSVAASPLEQAKHVYDQTAAYYYSPNLIASTLVYKVTNPAMYFVSTSRISDDRSQNTYYLDNLNRQIDTTYTITARNSVPEPSELALMLLGLSLMVLVGKGKKRILFKM